MLLQIEVDDTSLEETMRRYIDRRFEEQIAEYIKHRLSFVLEPRVSGDLTTEIERAVEKYIRCKAEALFARIEEELDKQLSTAIHARIAKMRILEPNKCAINAGVDEKLEKAIAHHLNGYSGKLRTELREMCKSLMK